MSFRSRFALNLAAVAAGAALFSGLAAADAGTAEAAEKTYAYTDKGSSFVPLRALKQLPGFSVEWNAASKQAVITEGGVKATLSLGQKTVSIGGKSRALSQAPFTENGTVFVPLRFILDQFGVTVKRQPSAGAIVLEQAGELLKVPELPRGSISLARKPVAVESKTIQTDGRSFSVQLATVSLMDPRVDLEVAAAHDKPGRTEELASIARRGGAMLAVNGTFFDAYTESTTKNPYGYLFNGGKMLYKSSGDKKTVVTFDFNLLTELLGGASFADRIPEGAVDGALQAGPRLLVDGAVKLDPKGEGFRDPKILTGGGARSALGITRDHKLLIATVGGATIPQLAGIMKAAGAWQAMNLDGGASSGLYYNGDYVTRPGRLLSNALLVRVD